MSENPKTIPSTAIESGGDESREYEIDPELDIRSEYFNPIKALYAPEIKIPVQNPRLYNNVAQYESAMKRLESGQTSVNIIHPPKLNMTFNILNFKRKMKCMKNTLYD